jgi:NAD(P)-dependent dehydrogenase (short-subunit alcohol dehydrogenase family)/AcrR family transcriptional regulator
METIPTTIKSKELVEKRREQIIQAAIKSFPKKGYHKTTLRDLADEAGISHGNIYDYVGSKEDIFLLVHETITGLADEALVRSIEHIDDPCEKLRRMIRSEFELSHTWSDAILFIYQDIHVLSRPLLKKLLKKESGHVARFKSVLDECTNKGLLRDCNTRVVANLIKIMIDSWVIKRWDLRGISEAEVENSILNLVFNGLRNVEDDRSRRKEEMDCLEGKRILVLNGGTVLGKAISSFLLSKGARLSIYHYTNGFVEGTDYNFSKENVLERVRFYPEKEHGPMTPQLFKKVVADFGQVDIIIQDLGISDIEIKSFKGKTDLARLRLDTNINLARNLFSAVQGEMNKRGSGRVLYLVPWAWDRHIDPLRYETVKAESVALTRTLARTLAESGTRINCIIPGYIGGIKNLQMQGEGTGELLDRIPKGRLGEVQDVVEAAFFLVSDASKYMTGQVLELDGGMNFESMM